MSETTEQQTPTPRPRGLDGADHADPGRRLWSLWREGRQPRVENFLEQAGVRDPEEIVMALRVDQAERCRLGQWVPAEHYLDAFPAVRDHSDSAIDLIFAEYVLREERGEQPPLEEFLRRFPEHAEELKLQIELHREMDDDPAQTAARSATWTTPGVVDGSGAYPSIPGFKVLGVLGRGGMGIVYRARQTELKRPVAIKMLIAGALTSPEAAARLRIEVEAMARLRHPNIVQIYGVGQYAGAPYLVLELVEGQSLAQTLAGTPQLAEWSARTMEALARGIHAAHLSGVVHRDLSPANILLADDGTPKITDFGLAKLIVGGGSLRTQTGDLLGTPSYMAPEQAEGSHRAIGVATDVYALGAILYEMLTGRPPFKAEHPLETLRQVTSDEPVSPSRLRPRLSRDLETICLKCLEKEQSKRYASALDLAADLGRYVVGEPIVARPPSAFETARHWVRKNLRAALWVLAVGTVSGVLFGYSLYFRFLQRPLTESIEASYGRLHATPPDWFAALAKPHEAINYALVLAGVVAMTAAGLAIVLLARPRSTGADLTHGLAVGLVAAQVSLMCGGGWAFAGTEVYKALLRRENVLALKDDLLQRQREVLIGAWAIPEISELSREIYEPDWQERRYPYLKGMSRDDQRRILYDKMVCDAIISVQRGLMYFIPLYFIVMIVVPGLEAVAAGSL
jgi:hypothetical protein